MAAIGLHWGWNFAGEVAGQLVAVDKLAPALHTFVRAAANLLVLALVVAVGRRSVRGAGAVRPLAA